MIVATIKYDTPNPDDTTHIDSTDSDFLEWLRRMDNDAGMETETPSVCDMHGYLWDEVSLTGAIEITIKEVK